MLIPDESRTFRVDIFSATAAVLRRWYVALPILLLTAFVAVQQFQSAKPTYTSTAYTLLLPPPPRAATPVITDPDDLITPLDPALAALGEGPQFISQLVVNNLETKAVDDRLRALGATAAYELDTDDRSSLIEYVVSSEDRDVSARTLEALIAETATVLAQVQQNLGATTPAVYRLQPAAPPQAPLEVAPERNRALIATLIGGGALAYLLALLVDAALAARRKHPLAPAVRGVVAEPASRPLAVNGDLGPVPSHAKPRVTFRKRSGSPADGAVAAAPAAGPVGVGSGGAGRE